MLHLDDQIKINIYSNLRKPGLLLFKGVQIFSCEGKISHCLGIVPFPGFEMVNCNYVAGIFDKENFESQADFSFIVWLHG